MVIAIPNLLLNHHVKIQRGIPIELYQSLMVVGFGWLRRPTFGFVGDAIKMGEAIGAATIDLEWVQVDFFWEVAQIFYLVN